MAARTLHLGNRRRPLCDPTRLGITHRRFSRNRPPPLRRGNDRLVSNTRFGNMARPVISNLLPQPAYRRTDRRNHPKTFFIQLPPRCLRNLRRPRHRTLLRSKPARPRPKPAHPERRHPRLVEGKIIPRKPIPTRNKNHPARELIAGRRKFLPTQRNHKTPAV